jgi:hypothetical protein
MGVTGYRRPTPAKPDMMDKSHFIYQPHEDGYMCPNGRGCVKTPKRVMNHAFWRAWDEAICGRIGASTGHAFSGVF